MNLDVKKLFEEPSLIQITTWARGVIENKDARDVVFALANAGSKEGKYVQAWENYVDLPDRVGVPVRAYARISDEPLLSKYVYENEHPDIVVLTNEALVKGNDVLEGMKPGGVLIVNTKRDPEYILKFLKDTTYLGTIGCIDATEVAGHVQTLSGAEGATDASGIGVGVGAVLAGAVVKARSIVKPENVFSSVQNQQACRYGYDEVRLVTVNTTFPEFKPAPKKPLGPEDLPFAGTVPSVDKENEKRITGNWRSERPVWSKERCTNCLLCWVTCPDSVVVYKTPEAMDFTNLKYCKGCGICASVCPTKAITMVPELDFED
ncbi:MAG: 2-oxoacid:acceptor oxidoreductase family protein [Acetomicrobium sp.]